MSNDKAKRQVVKYLIRQTSEERSPNLRYVCVFKGVRWSIHSELCVLKDSSCRSMTPMKAFNVLKPIIPASWCNWAKSRLAWYDILTPPSSDNSIFGLCFSLEVRSCFAFRLMRENK